MSRKGIKREMSSSLWNIMANDNPWRRNIATYLSESRRVVCAPKRRFAYIAFLTYFSLQEQDGYHSFIKSNSMKLFNIVRKKEINDE